MRSRISARFGADFTTLWTASAVTNIGDGITMAAGPLLVASFTADPVLVAGSVLVQQLPWLLFALHSGAWVDRVDRRRVVVVVNVARAGALATLALALAGGVGGIPLIYAVFFLLGTGETLADTASGALVPAVVAPDRLEAANGRLFATFTVANQFVAKPLGAALFAVAAALPFGVNAATFAASAALVATIRPVPGNPAASAPGRLRADIAAGLRWLWRHRLLRALAVSMGFGNVAFGAAFAVFVLHARERLGLAAFGYGLLLTTFAVGGLAGAGLAARLRRRCGTAALLRAGLLVEALTHAVLAATTSSAVAAAVLVLFGVQTMSWGVIVVTLRQRAVPDHLMGRVGSVFALLDLGGAALGSLVGGLVARQFGVTGPFWAAAAAMLLVAAAAWRPLGTADR